METTREWKTVTLINAATASNTDPVAALGTNTCEVSERGLKSIVFSASAVGGGGTGTFKVYVSNDATTWVLYNRLISNGTVADGHNPALVGSVAITAVASPAICFFPVGDYFKYIGVSLAVTVGTGTFSAVLQTAA